MKTENIGNGAGRKVAEQYRLTDDSGVQFFMSYGQIIARRETGGQVTLDGSWSGNHVTRCYLAYFLSVDGTAAIRGHVASGEYAVTNLND